MVEEKEGVKGALAGWIKGLLTSVFGLFTGAVIMYLTPLVNNAIKPAKPIANFAAQTVGLNATFNNRSSGACEGWWDFGDGTALEPFDPKLELVTHSYKKPGIYNVKLTLQNLLGDGSDRTASVTIDAESAPGPQLEFAAFEVTTLTPAEVAPAVYYLTAKVTGATQCILCRGDNNQPMQVLDDPSNIREIINFKEMGYYTIRLAAFNGKQVIEKTHEICLGGGGESNPLLAKLKVSYDAMRVERTSKLWRIHCGWQADLKDTISPFRRERMADHGCQITSFEVVNKNDPGAPRKLDCKLSEDRCKIILTGELTRQSGLMAPTQTAPSFLAEVKATMEHRSAAQTINRGDVTMAVTPGQAVKIPMQPVGPGWEVARTQTTVELWEGTRMLWSGTPPVVNAPMQWKNQTCTLSAVQQSDGVLVTIVGASAPVVAPKTPTVPATPVVLPKPEPVVPAVMPPQTPGPVGPVIRRTGADVDPRRLLTPHK